MALRSRIGLSTSLGVCCLGALQAGEEPGGPFVNLAFDNALDYAGKQGLVVFIDFFTTWCGPCKQMDRTTWQDQKVIALLKRKTVPLKIDAEKEAVLSRKYGIDAYPTLLLVRPDGSVLGKFIGYRDPEAFLTSLLDALAGKLPPIAVPKENPKDPDVQIRQRMAEASELGRDGKADQALEAYLWVYDVGLPKVSSGAFPHLFRDALVGLGKLSGAYPPAQAALAKRREATTQALLSAPTDTEAASRLVLSNGFLNEPQVTLSVFDCLPKDSAGRMVLGLSLGPEFVARRRYEDAVQFVSLDRIMKRLETLEIMIQASPATSAQVRNIPKNFDQLVGDGIEALAGVGRAEDARRLVTRGLALDGSPEMRGLIKHRLERAGMPFEF